MQAQQSERGQFSFEQFAGSSEYVEYNKGFVDRTLDVKPRAVVLDMGCGTGLVTGFIRDRFNGVPATIIGIDPNPASIAIAREHVLSVGQTHVRFIQSPGEKVIHEMESDVVDAAYFANAIHEIPEREKLQVLRATHDVVKPGGKLHITSTYTGEWSKGLDGAQKWGMWKLRALRKLGGERNKSQKGIEILSTGEYGDLLRKAGFVVDSDKTRVVPVPLSSDSLRGISLYDSFIEGVFADMENTGNVTLAAKSTALIEALNDMEEGLRTETGNPRAVLTLKRNWVEITAQKPL